MRVNDHIGTEVMVYKKEDDFEWTFLDFKTEKLLGHAHCFLLEDCSVYHNRIRGTISDKKSEDLKSSIHFMLSYDMNKEPCLYRMVTRDAFPESELMLFFADYIMGKYTYK